MTSENNDDTTTTPSSSTVDDDTTTTPSSSTVDDDTTTDPPTTATTTSRPGRQHISWCDSYTKAQTAIDSLSSILSSVPPSLSSSETPALSLLHDPGVTKEFSKLLRQPDSGGGDNNLCRWLYDTFQSSIPDLHLVVLRFLPIVAGVYLSRASLRKPLAGFEAVLLALYAHETTSRNGQAVTVSIPDLSHSSIYHESKQTTLKNGATELNLAVISPTLEPHGAVRSTRRARIVGVALELYYSKISQMPVESKIDFCEFCQTWTGENGDDVSKDLDPQADQGQHEHDNEVRDQSKGKEGRINIPWEILQPVLRILGHCLIGPDKNKKELYEAACSACRALYKRSLHDINPKAILATGSLLKLAKMDQELSDNIDYTEITQTNVINL